MQYPKTKSFFRTAYKCGLWTVPSSIEELGDKFKVVLAGKLVESAGKQGRGGGWPGKSVQYGAERQHGWLERKPSSSVVRTNEWKHTVEYKCYIPLLAAEQPFPGQARGTDHAPYPSFPAKLGKKPIRVSPLALYLCARDCPTKFVLEASPRLKEFLWLAVPMHVSSSSVWNLPNVSYIPRPPSTPQKMPID
jgi:hypothetical protein